MGDVTFTCKDGVQINFTGGLKEFVFSKNLQPMQLPPLWKSKDIKYEYDQYNEYTLNSLNYRSPEFIRDVDFIAAGCSVTFGTGVQDDAVWPNLVAKHFDASYVNISTPGASVEWICDSVYKYIDTYGPPKKAILIIFPDLLRGQLAYNKEVNIAAESGMNDFYPQYYNEDFSRGLIGHDSLYYISTENPAPRVTKKPYPIEHTVPREEPLIRSIKEIKKLERFAKYLNLNLIWSSWSEDLVELAADLPDEYRFDYFMDLSSLREWQSHFSELPVTEEDPEGIVDHKLDHRSETLELYGCTDELEGQGKCRCYSNCHFDLESLYGQTFHLATDRFNHGKNHAHFGVHRLIHIAEDFIERIEEKSGL